MSRDLRVLGRRVVLVGDEPDPDLAAWLTQHWDHPETATALRSDYAVELRFGEGSGPDPSELPAAGDTDFWLAAGGSSVHSEIRSEGACLTLYARPFVAWTELFRALAQALVGSGLALLHTGAITYEGRTLLLVGPSGVGKSTTTLRAIAAGWTPLAEDLAWLDPPSCRIFGFDRRLGVRPPTVAVLAELFPDVDPGPMVGPKHDVSYDALGGRCWEAELTDVVSLRRTPDEASAWLPLSQAETAMALLGSLDIPTLPAHQRRYAEIVAQVAPRVGGWILRLGATPLPLGSPPRREAAPALA